MVRVVRVGFAGSYTTVHTMYIPLHTQHRLVSSWQSVVQNSVRWLTVPLGPEVEGKESPRSLLHSLFPFPFPSISLACACRYAVTILFPILETPVSSSQEEEKAILVCRHLFPPTGGGGTVCPCCHYMSTTHQAVMTSRHPS
jgi:hypothetical protein